MNQKKQIFFRSMSKSQQLTFGLFPGNASGKSGFLMKTSEATS